MCPQTALIGNSQLSDRGNSRRRPEGPSGQPLPHPAAKQKAKHLTGKADFWRPEAPQDGRALASAGDSAQRRFRPCGKRRTRLSAARQPTPTTPTWLPPPCHYEPDDRAAAVLRTSGDHEFARSGRQPFAALKATRSQNIATCTGGHAGTEAMLLRPAAVIGLERTLHEGPPRPGDPVGIGQIVDSLTRVVVWKRARPDACARSPTPVRRTTLEGGDQMQQHRCRATVPHPSTGPRLRSSKGGVLLC